MHGIATAIDDGKPVKTHDVLEVLVNMLAQCVIVHAFDRAGAAQTMKAIASALEQALALADFPEPPPAPDTRH